KSEAEEIVVYEGEQWPKQNIDEAEAAVPFFQCDPRARRRIAVHVTDVVAKCRVGVVNECVFEPAGGTVNFHRGMSGVFLEFPCAAADEAQLGIGIESAVLDPAAQKK